MTAELVTLIGSTLVGGVLKIWGMSNQAKQEREMATLQAMNTKAKIIKDAREFKNESFQWTRNIIAIMSIGSIVVLPIAAALIGQLIGTDVSITHGWTEWKGGFWFFTEGKEVMKWHTVTGPTITPMHTQLVSAIAGLFLGGILTGRGR